MSRRRPFIELADYERLRDLERRTYYSPVAILLTLVGLAGGVYWFWGLRRGLEVFPQTFLLGYGIFLAAYLGLLAYYYGFRFRRLKCPGCDQIMQPYLANLDEGGWRRFIRAIEVDGRYYREPFDADDARPWVRLMKSVWRLPPLPDVFRLLTPPPGDMYGGRVGTTPERLPAS